MGRRRRPPNTNVQEPDVHVEWVRAEPSPQQARAWRRLWQKLLAPDDQDGEPTHAPRAVQVGDKTCADDEYEHDRLQDQ